MTLLDLINILSNDEKIEKNKNSNVKVIMNTNEVLNKYPMFTRFTLNKAIKEQNLPFFREGHKMFFEKELIEKWISIKTSTYKNKNRL